MRQKYRLTTYVPDGAELGQLTHPSKYSFSSPNNEISGLTLEYRDDMPNASRLFTPVEVGVEYSVDGTLWQEPPNGRYLRLGRGRELVGPSPMRSYTMPGYGHLLRKMRQMKTTGLVDGKRLFNAANTGMIMKPLIDEAQARGVCTGMLYDFTTTLDSAGVAWNKSISIGVDVGMDLYTILTSLSGQGMVEWYFQGRTLLIFNAGSLDITRPVTLRAGIDIEGMPVEGSIDEMVHTALVLGDNGVTKSINSSYSPPQYWGKWEGFIGNGGVTDDGTMTLLADQVLGDGAKEKIQYTAELATAVTAWEPFRDFQSGQSVTAPNEAGNPEAFQIQDIQITRESDGKRKVSLVINDRFVKDEIRRAKRLLSLNGATPGGTGTKPTVTPGKLVPKAPTSLLISSTVAPNEAGFPRAICTVDWPDVTQDVGNLVIDVDTYEVQAFPGSSTTPEFWGSTTQSVFSKTNLVPGSTWSVQVRAVADGVKSAWSAVITDTMETDTTPPGVPTDPVMSSALGTVSANWDGKAVGGAPMPADLLRVELFQEGVPDPVDSLIAAGFVTIGGLTPGDTLSYAFRAVDKAGNASALTPYVPITVTSVASDAALQAELDLIAADIAAGVEDQVLTATNSLNKITYSINSPSAAGARPGDTWFKRMGGEVAVSSSFPGFLDGFTSTSGTSTTTTSSDPGFIIGQWEWNGVVWAPRTLENDMIANLNAGKITVGEMSGLRIKAGTIRADRLAVGMQDNLIPDVYFKDAGINAARSLLGWAYDSATTTFTNSTQPTAVLSLAADGTSTDYLNLIKVMPGEKYYVSAVVTSSIDNSFRFSSTGYDLAGTKLVAPVTSPAVVILADVATTVGGVMTIPSNCYYLNPGVVFSTNTAATNRVRNPALVKQVPAVVIEDGAITAGKIAVGAVVANNIKVGALDGMTITAPNIRTAATGDRTQLTPNGIQMYKGNSVKVSISQGTGQLRIYSTGDLTHTSTAHGFQVGDDDGQNLAVDLNEIMSRNAGSYGQLLFNREGGEVFLGGKPGGFTPTTLGQFPATDNHRFEVRAAMEISNVRVGDYNDNYSPLIVGLRGGDHLWFDGSRIGASSGGASTHMYIMPPERDGTNHDKQLLLCSDTLGMSRITGQNARIFGRGEIDAGLQFFQNGLRVTNTSTSVYRDIAAASFTVSSQIHTKEQITDIDDVLGKLKKAKSRRWQYKPTTNDEDRWHFGPMLEDLPAELAFDMGGGEKGYDVSSLLGLAWEAIRELINKVETLESRR